MNADTFLENFEILPEAPGGIDRLRELILSLAVRGKLVAQDPHEPTIFDELEDIDPNEVGEMLSSERQLETGLPSNWVYAGFRHIGRWVGGNGFPTDKQGGRNKEVLFCKVSDMNLEPNSKYIFETVNSLDLTTAKEMRVTPHNVGTVIFPKIGGAIATNKRRLLVKPTVIDNNCMGVSPSSVINPEWLYVLFRSIDLTKYQSGTSVPSISQRVLDEIRFGVPPRAEQKRIVTKVDELMALCDQLEQQQKHRDNLRTATRKSAIDAISTAQTPEELDAAWKRINNNWEVIADTPASIESLRGLILDLAVTDRLVESNNSQLSEQVMSFESPKNVWTTFSPRGWKCLSLEDASDQITDGTHQTPNYIDSGVPFLSIKDISSGRLDFSSTRFISPKEHKKLTQRVKPQRGDVLICRIGTLGKAVSVDTDEEFSIFVSLGLIRPKDFVNPKFLAMLLNSPISHQQFDAIKAGGSHTVKLNLGSLRKFVLWIPSLEVQELILTKVDELMALCDQLESEIKTRSEVAEKFSRSILEVA